MILTKRMVITALCCVLFFIPGLIIAQELEPGLYAQLDTSKGKIVAILYYQQVPLTVTNFVGLAQGTIESNLGKAKKFYDGLTFHRVIPNFMAQAGDPKGDGSGGPGYEFPDEFVDGLKHDSAGILSMANAGPGTNGSQFFITHLATPWLDNKHTIFGKVVQGLDVLKKIGNGDIINSIEILRIGDDAKAFKADQQSFKALLEEKTAKQKAEYQKQQIRLMVERKQYQARFDTEMALTYPKVIKLASGLMFVIMKEGQGPSPAIGTIVKAHVTTMFKDGKVINTSTSGEPYDITVEEGEMVSEALITMKKGETRRLLVPYMLAFGEDGYKSIPPKSDLMIDVVLVDFK
ncbi:MAG: peptidylprolyl isomerase [Pseudomonadota bacterium]